MICFRLCHAPAASDLRLWRVGAGLRAAPCRPGPSPQQAGRGPGQGRAGNSTNPTNAPVHTLLYYHFIIITLGINVTFLSRLY
jgi:hypothetical protein